MNSVSVRERRRGKWFIEYVGKTGDEPGRGPNRFVVCFYGCPEQSC
jgi:hypothetical protein